SVSAVVPLAPPALPSSVPTGCRSRQRVTPTAASWVPASSAVVWARARAPTPPGSRSSAPTIGVSRPTWPPTFCSAAWALPAGRRASALEALASRRGGLALLDRLGGQHLAHAGELLLRLEGGLPQADRPDRRPADRRDGQQPDRPERDRPRRPERQAGGQVEE